MSGAETSFKIPDETCEFVRRLYGKYFEDLIRRPNISKEDYRELLMEHPMYHVIVILCTMTEEGYDGMTMPQRIEKEINEIVDLFYDEDDDVENSTNN
jgi:hypothetical protein